MKFKKNQIVINIANYLGWNSGTICQIDCELFDNIYLIKPAENVPDLQRYRKSQDLIPANKFFRRLYNINEI